jgi:hypothetical protein
LSPSPEDAMEARQTRSQTGAISKREYSTLEPTKETFRFGPSSGWGRKQLDALGVTFDPSPEQRITSLVSHYGWTQADWSSELKKRYSIMTSF